ncbi:RNA polymerase I-specific transcription initiation factor RRN3 [Eumeta japonica]|uniref:RNA polymerase I-specific transcription initiation factor RRN3 n=1 Tax=Eumeta variegata TaxID=151549 RepID=A0A4C1VS04_EUMVA|nr:RNA polymerase I-specific transcription initiation factor RRN3 [Eumeta japonica]
MYSDILPMLRDPQLSDENFTRLFEDCSACVVLLGREVKPFVEVICDVTWLNRNDDLVALYSKFLLNLVTAHPYYTPLVMASLMKNLKVGGENWDENPPEELIFKWSNVHTIIAQIIAIMPMSSTILMQNIVEQFPYYKLGSYCNRAYVYNLIWVTKYIPALQEQIITAIINRLVVMDVNMVDKSRKQSIQNEAIFSMEIDDDETVISETLDFCMLEMLQWLQDERDSAMNVLCNVFERVILPTHGIRHVQFLILYIISINQQCADRILTNLWMMAAGCNGLGPGALATRKTAASHLAGLLARCIRIPNTRLIQFLRNMADWCHSYITATQEAATASENVKVHGAFHAICHAIFYLVAFKHQHLFMNKTNINFIQSLNLSRLVTCVLNPLKTCPPQVIRAFSSVTRAHQVVYCQAIIERNARQSIVTEANAHYDEWFPYDPYTLPKSGEIIWPLCIDYKDWLQEGDDETQYSSMMKKLEDDDDYLMTSPKSKIASSLSNCISPGFKSM